jgi:ABC-2 type transport system ATP-binding protein
MDEPAANLDPKARTDFFNELLELKKQGKAIFISSHILAELDKYTDSITILDGGKTIYSGTKNNLIKKIGNNKYICSSNNNAKFINILKSNKIKYEVNDNKTIAINIKEESIRNLTAKMSKNKLYFTTLNLCNYSLQDIYDKMIMKGSVDTMNND